MKSVFAFLSLFSAIILSAHAQHINLKGIIRDAETNAPLPFVSILINKGPNGATSDIDGKFQIINKEPVQKVVFSYLGYERQVLELNGATAQTLLVKLKPATNNLQEVVIRAGYNPAHRIIKLATQNRKRNDPAELPEYSYRVYNKTIVTMEPYKADMTDTLQVMKDNPKEKPKPKTAEQQRAEAKAALSADSSRKEMEAFLAKSYLFLSESVADHAFKKPNLDKETVLATRVAGLKNPSFAMLATDSKAFSVYQELVDFFGKNYLSPLSQGSTKKYDFRLEDTTYTGNDTTYIISYKPFPDKNFEGLKGQLHISSDGWAVENIIAESNGKDQQGIKLQQHYEKVGNRTWFMTQVNTDYKVGTMRLNDHTPTALTRSYYTNINLEPQLKRREFKAVTIKINPDAAKQPEEFWAQYRPDTLSSRERGTYSKLDSLGKAENFEAKLRFAEALFSKQLPIGSVSIDLNRIFKVNRYEAVRLGVGAHTNEKFSEFLSVGGYVGYGFRDKGFKYGSDLSFNLYKPQNLKLILTHFEDVQESGGTILPFYNPPLIGNNLRPLIIRNMDKVTHQSAFLSARILKYLDLRVGMQQEQKRPTNGYTFQTNSENISDNFSNNFRFTEAVIGARYAFREQVMQMFNKNISMGTSYPILWFQYRRGLNGVLDGDYAYDRFDARVEKTIKNKMLGTTKLTLTGGLVQGEVPYSNLFNGNGAFDTDYRVYTGEGFQTMGLTEFLSDRFAAVYLRHNFGKLLYKTEKFAPSLAAVTNIGFGSLNNPEQHRNLDFKTMEKGFYESGLLVNDLFVSGFSSVGLGAFYRYGAYQKEKTLDNFALKLSVAFTF